MTIYLVRPGDTLAAIARANGVSVQRLISDNGIADPRQLAEGQALLILRPAVIHTVQRGDTLYGIANAYGVSILELYQRNPALSDQQALLPGQQLTIRLAGAPKRRVSVSGYVYPFIQPPVLYRALPFLTYLAVFSYGFRPDGSLIVPEDTALIAAAYRYRAAPVLVFTAATEDGGFDTGRLHLLLSDEALQRTVTDRLLAVMLEKGYLGLDADFEFILPEDAAAYAAFLETLAARLRAEGLFLTAALAPKTSADQSGLLYEAHDYPTLGAIADRVLLMTYEWGYTYGPPMAVAPLPQVERVVRYGVSEIDRSKILMGVPNYGYVWTLPYEQGVSRATSLGNQYAVELAARAGAVIRYDETAQSPWFRYRAGGRDRVCWFEDVRSIKAKLDLMDEYGLLGPGFWNILRPFAQNWAYLGATYEINKIV